MKIRVQTMRYANAALLGTAFLHAAALLGFGQQITGVPGSPNATTTVEGTYPPPPPAQFGGIINLQADQSRPWWPPQVEPPKGAPNILLIMTDDQGYRASGTFGGVIVSHGSIPISRLRGISL